MAERTAALVRSAGGDAIGLQLDVLDEAQVDATFNQAVAHYGQVDVLLNLAGDTKLVKSVDCTVEDFDRILRLNVTGQFLTARAAARRMLARGGGGSIINISSILGYGGIPRRAAYSSSRAAIINLTRTLAIEWALDGIRVNCVAPGWTMTEALQNVVDAGLVDLEPLLERTPMGRLPVADDIADVVVFLASDASRMVTGVTIPIDGGVTAYMGPGGKPSLA
jgi:NAD(P)-dependent dehydrogenase (short-subunit alcohol dehydrogenase family)